MKLTGNKRNGRYASNERNMAPQPDRNGEQQFVGPRAAKAAMKKKKMRRTRRILGAVLLVVIALSAVLYSTYLLGVKPPDTKPKPPKAADPSSDVTDGTNPVGSTDRKTENIFTFAILGFDDGSNNTDTMMVATFDADNHTLHVVNIPRDTLVNVKWNTKKANTLYANGGVEGVVEGLSDVFGFEVDNYVKVDLKAFIKLVDAVDGIDFDVPRDMDYEDPSQNLSIHFKKGPKHLDGQEAMEVMRFRKGKNGYPDADIGRIGTQQDFLLTAAEQIIAKQNKLNLTELADVFLKYVETDLTLGNLVWYGKEFYKMDAENITFTTLPAKYNDSVNNLSYVTIHLNDWLKVLNEKINPFKEDITEGDLSIFTRDANGKLYVTDGVYAGKKSWGAGSSSSGSSDKPSVSAKPSVSPSPSHSPSPSPSIAPSPSINPSPSPSDDPPPSPSEESSPEVSPTEPAGGASPSPSPDLGASPSPSP